MDGLLNKFGNRVRELRKAQGLSQEELAEKANLHFTYVGAVEKGERNLSLKAIQKIAHGLGVNISELFSFYRQKKIVNEAELTKTEIMKILRNEDIDTLHFISKLLKNIIRWSKKHRVSS